MYRILVIDDQRIFNFDQRGIKEPQMVEHVTTSQEGLRRLYDSAGWDEVWLDHDLGMESRGSGWDIVRTILHGGDLPTVNQFYVHTMNPVGADRMVKALGQFYNVVRVHDPTPLLDFDEMDKANRNPFLVGPRR